MKVEKEIMLGKFVRFVFFLPLTFFLVTPMACTGVHVPESLNWKEVPITEITRIVGEWEGLTWSEPRTRHQDDWVKMSITEEGQFKFSSYRTIGVWLGSGKLILEKGKLVTESQPDAGSATFTLYESDGMRMLKVQGMTKTGRRQIAELNPAKNTIMK